MEASSAVLGTAKCGKSSHKFDDFPVRTASLEEWQREGMIVIQS